MSKTLKLLLADISPVPLSDDISISELTQDSRKVSPGSLFIACQGETVDGRDFIPAAVEKGAAAILYQSYLSDNPWENHSFSVPVIPIADLNHKVGLLAARFYNDPTRQMSVVGVTGTNGKTSCTHFIAQALNHQHKKTAVMGTVGYGFLPNLYPATHTTPDAISIQKNLALLQQQGAQAIAMEVSSHALVQHRVVGVNFDIAVFTQLSRDHLDYHKTMENYANAKKRLFAHPNLRYGIVNIDDEVGMSIVKQYASSLNIITYSAVGKAVNSHSSIVAKTIKNFTDGFIIEVETPWGAGTFKSSLLGRFNVSNLLAVLGVLGAMDVPLNSILDELANMSTVCGRMQCFGGGGKPSVVVDYAHTPDALEKALLALREHCRGKLWCVFGCGGDRDKGKRPQMGEIAERLSDYMIITNDNPRTESPEAIISNICQGLSDMERIKIILEREKAIRYAIQSASTNDIVLVAGKGHETYQVIGNKTYPFSDIDVVKKILEL